jgi:hypothetical protein
MPPRAWHEHDVHAWHAMRVRGVHHVIARSTWQASPAMRKKKADARFF